MDFRPHTKRLFCLIMDNAMLLYRCVWSRLEQVVRKVIIRKHQRNTGHISFKCTFFLASPFYHLKTTPKKINITIEKEKTLHLVVPNDAINDLMTLYKKEVPVRPLPHTCFGCMTRTKGQAKVIITKATKANIIYHVVLPAAEKNSNHLMVK